MSPLRILRSGIDTLWVSFVGEANPEIITRLEELKAIAQATEDPEPIELGGQVFYVQPKGLNNYPFLIKSRDFSILIGRGRGKGRPTAQIHFSQFGLVTIDPQRLVEYGKACISELGPLFEYGVARVDVAVDWQGWAPTLYEMSECVICPSPERPIHPNIKNPESFYFGKRPMLRLYNKTAEGDQEARQTLVVQCVRAVPRLRGV